MIDRKHEQVIPLRKVPNHLPSRMPGKKLSFATVWRWALRSQNPLETFCTPGGRFTSMEALDRFVERCSIKRNSEPKTQRTDVSTSVRARHAGERLRELMGRQYRR